LGKKRGVGKLLLEFSKGNYGSGIVSGAKKGAGSAQSGFRLKRIGTRKFGDFREGGSTGSGVAFGLEHSPAFKG